MDKRCGNCRWWKALDDEDGYGDCGYPLPPLPLTIANAPGMYDDEGADCPTFEAREASE